MKNREVTQEEYDDYQQLKRDYADAVVALRAFNDAYSFISENAPAPMVHAVRKARRVLITAKVGGYL